MKKLIWFVILVAIIIGAVFLLRGNEDTWIKASDGRWVRHGNPALPIPQNVLQDCYDQNSNRALDFAIIACREDLCGADSVCARSLEQEFEKLNDNKSKNQLRREAVGAPTEASEENNETIEPSNSNVPTSIPTSTAPEPIDTVNRNVNVPSPEPAPQEKLVIELPANITIESPAPKSTVASPLVITGKVKANAGDPITIQITNTSGTVLISETAKLKNVDFKTGWGTYKITITYEFSSTKDGFVTVSTNSTNKASVPVTFN